LTVRLPKPNGDHSFAIQQSVRLAPQVTIMAQDLGIYQATLGESGETTAEVSTEEVRRILADGSARVLDTRKPSEFQAGHLPGALNVMAKDDVPPAENVAAVMRTVGADRG